MKYLSMLVLAILVCAPVSAQRQHGKRVYEKAQVERVVQCEKACKCVCHRTEGVKGRKGVKRSHGRKIDKRTHGRKKDHRSDRRRDGRKRQSSDKRPSIRSELLKKRSQRLQEMRKHLAKAKKKK